VIPTGYFSVAFLPECARGRPSRIGPDHRCAIAAVILACACALSASLLAEQQPLFRSGTQVVSLFATVVDAQKRLVPGLAKEDFEVLDNDKPQPLVFFQSETQPITVIAMLDTSGSMTGTIPLLRAATEQLLLRLLPADKGRVGAFNDKIQFSSRFTSDRDELVR